MGIDILVLGKLGPLGLFLRGLEEDRPRGLRVADVEIVEVIVAVEEVRL